MNKKLLSILKFLTFLGIGVLLFWLVVKDHDLEALIAKAREADYFWVFLTIVLGILSHISRAIRWNMLITPLGYHSTNANAFFAVMIGYMTNLAFPRMGEIVRCGILKKYEGVPINKLIGTMITERVVDLIILLLLLLLTFLLQIDLLQSFMGQHLFIPLQEQFSLKSSLIIGLIAVGAISLIVIALVLLFKKNKRLYYKALILLRGLMDGIRTIRNMKSNMAFIGHSLLIWLCYYLMAYLFFFAFESTSGLGLVEGLSILTLGSLGIVAPVQGGLGAYHFIVTETLTLYEVSREDGIVFATVIHAAHTLMLLFLGAISLILVPYFNKKR